MADSITRQIFPPSVDYQQINPNLPLRLITVYLTHISLVRERKVNQTASTCKNNGHVKTCINKGHDRKLAEWVYVLLQVYKRMHRLQPQWYIRGGIRGE